VDNNFEILKNITNEELYNLTYISLDNLEAIKNKNFKAFHRFKLIGFIDILSKRLNLDLSDFKKEATKYFDSVEPIVAPSVKSTNIPTIDFNKKTLLFGGIAIASLISIFSIYSLLTAPPSKDLTKVVVSPPSNIEVTPPLKEVAEVNQTIELNTSETNNSIVTTIIEQKSQPTQTINTTPPAIKIIPKKQVWVGIIDLDTKEKKEYTTTEELVIDTTKNQIIVVNRAYISLVVGDVEKEYNFDGRVRFIYKDGEIKEIKLKKFKALNDGKVW